MKTGNMIAYTLALAGSAFADVKWTGTTGGNLDDTGNWSGAIPTATAQYATIDTPQSAPFTLSGDSMTFPRLKLDSTSWSVKATNVFDLGAGKSALAYRFFFKGAAAMHLKSGIMGTYAGGDRVFIGDDQDNNGVSYGGNTLIVDGGNSEFRAGNFIGLGVNNANNTILVENGGTVSARMRIGSNFAYCTNNLLRVTGSGSSLVSASAECFDIGACGSYNKAEFLNGGVLSCSGHVVIGNYQLENGKGPYLRGAFNSLLFDGEGTVGEITGRREKGEGSVYVGLSSSSNTCTVGNGALMRHHGNVCIGFDAEEPAEKTGFTSNSCGNVFLVDVGGTVSNVLGSTSCRFAVGSSMHGTGNVLRVKGTYVFDGNRGASHVGDFGVGSLLDVDGGTFIAKRFGGLTVGSNSNAGANGHKVRVANGGLIEHDAYGNFWLTVGNRAFGCGLEVDNATLRLNTCNCGEGCTHDLSAGLAIGGYASASNCYASCVNGGLIEVMRVVVGDHAPNCTFLVSDSTVNASGSFDVGYAVDDTSCATNATVILEGNSAKVRIGGAMRIRHNSKLVYRIPLKGDVVTPVVSCRSLETDYGDGLKIVVELEKGRRSHRSVTLLETTAARCPIDDVTYNRFSFELPPGVRIERTTHAIIAHISPAGGTIFTIR